MHQTNCFAPGYSGADERGDGAGAGCNLNVPLPAGSSHETYRHAFERIVIPALKAFKPELIIVGSGQDANAVDPLARMLLNSESFRTLTKMLLDTAAELCSGKLVVVHEGGYAEAYVPFCGHAVLEALSGETTDVADPALDMFRAQQPDARTLAFRRLLIEEMAEHQGVPQP